MEYAVRNVVLPFYGYDFKQGVNICPALYRQKHVVRIFTAVENIHAVKIKINYIYLLVVLPQIIAQPIHIMTPAAVHKQQIFAVKVGYLQFVLIRKLVMYRNGAAEFPSDKLKSGAAAQVEHSFIKNAADNVNVFPEICKYLAGVFGGVFKRHYLEFHIGAERLNL